MVKKNYTPLYPSLQAGTEDVKGVLSRLSQLRYELLTNKEMTGVEEGCDVEQWRGVFSRYKETLQGQEPLWFTVSWLFAECYMYRKIIEAFQKRSVYQCSNSWCVDWCVCIVQLVVQLVHYYHDKGNFC